MESVDLEMNDVFGEEVDDMEDIGAVGALPDLPESTQLEDTEDADNAEVDKRLKALSKGAAKKVVRNPQPKLDATRLTGDRGIPILPRIGEKIKFKGKNHEAEDLSLLMRHMEHWAHRLFPKMPFDEVIQRVEKLGSKGPVKTCVRKIRLDMPVLADEFVGSDAEDDVERNGDEGERVDRNAEAMWDELLEEEAELRAMEAGKQQNITRKEDSAMETDEQQETIEEKIITKDNPVPSQTGTPAAQRPVANGTFTPEQLQRMERNKQLALERKLKKSRLLSPAPKRPEPSPSEMFIATPIQHVMQESLQVSMQESSQVPSQSQGDKSEIQQSEVTEQGPSQNILIEQKQDDAQRWCSHTASSKHEDMSPSLASDDAQSQSQLLDSDNQQSEVIEQGPSQNIQIEQKQEGAPGHCMETFVSKCENGDISQKQGTDEQSSQKNHTKENKIHTKNTEHESNTVSRSDYLNNGSVQVNDSVPYSEEMSEIIPKQNSENIVLTPMSMNDKVKQGAKIDEKSFDETLQCRYNKDFQLADKENIGSKNNFGTEITSIKEKMAIDEFDDELSEEQLLQSLDP